MFTESTDAFLSAAELAETVTLNGTPGVLAVPGKSGVAEEAGALFNYAEVAFALSDYSSIDYSTDTLVLWGATWKYPEELSRDPSFVIVRFRRNERPIGFR